MSTGSNILWVGLGVAVGYALALYIDQLDIDQLDIDQEDDGDDDHKVDAPDLRVVDEECELDDD
jgi:hypothetical protein|tara:strand:+ start:43 stop:234 length:192 start_codon:yes stop_codon:yes gene_type:complete